MEVVAKIASTLLALSMAACQGNELPRTEIMLVVDTDLRAPAQLDHIDMRIAMPGSPVQTASAILDGTAPPLPRSVALVHQGGSLGPLLATVEAKLAGRIILQRKARLSFVPGQTLVLPMHLVAHCLTVECGDNTCTEHGCQSIDIDPASLSPYSGTEPKLTDMGADIPIDDAGIAHDASTNPPVDSSVEPPSDASQSDASRSDASQSDAGMCIPTTETCNDRDDDCDGIIDDGFDLSRDPNNCGNCGVRCNGATRRCCSGTCRMNC